VYLVPAAVLIGFAAGLLIPFWLSLPDETRFPIFLGTLALSLLVVFAAARERWVPLVLAAVLALVALVDVVAPDTLANGAGLVPYVVPLVLMAVGLYLLAERRSG